METYKVIADEKELKWWWDYGVPPLQRNEIYFCSRSARNKQLTEAEREYYKCGRSEMWNKIQIRHDSWNAFYRAILGFEVRKDAFTTKAGVPYPAKALVTYWNICPIDARKAMIDQMSYLTELTNNLADAAIKASQKGIDEAFYKIRKSFDTCQSLFARNFGKKEWLDIDVDTEFSDATYYLIKSIFETDTEIGRENILYVRTGGGIHCLIRKSALHMNPEWICERIRKAITAKEVIVNRNEMIALPGTWMYGNHIVTVLNKNDLKDVEPFKHGEDE